MKGESYPAEVKWAGTLVALACVACVSLGQLAADDKGDGHSACEREALRAYRQALKVCELAQNPNPRLRCYEAARETYWRVLDNCGRSGSN
jgi:hypothetical protein